MVPVSYHVGLYVTQLFFLGHMTHTTSDRCKLYHRRYQEGNTWMGGTQMDKKSDIVDTTRMDKTAGKT